MKEIGVPELTLRVFLRCLTKGILAICVGVGILALMAFLLFWRPATIQNGLMVLGTIVLYWLFDHYLMSWALRDWPDLSRKVQ
jgi:hypothetical protein